jgi:hypothetical protein
MAVSTWMSRGAQLLAAAGLAAALAAPAQASVLRYVGNFADETGTGSAGTGYAVALFDTLTNIITYNVAFSGLGTGVTIAHVHCCTPNPGVGNVGVASPTPSFPGFPTGVTSGSYMMSFDLDNAPSWNGAFITNNGGSTASAIPVLLSGLATGRAYFNIHTQQFGGGEVRAVMRAVPAPATAGLLVLALALLGLAAPRRHGA